MRFSERIVFSSENLIKDYLQTEGELAVHIEIPAGLLVPNSYKIKFAIHVPNVEFVELLPDVLQFTILDTGSAFAIYGGADYGCVFVNCKWTNIR